MYLGLMNEKIWINWSRRVHPPRHLKAIKDTGNDLVVAMDIVTPSVLWIVTSQTPNFLQSSSN